MVRRGRGGGGRGREGRGVGRGGRDIALRRKNKRKSASWKISENIFKILKCFNLI